MGFVVFIGVERGFIFEGESIRGQKSVRFNFGRVKLRPPKSNSKNAK